MSSRTKGTTVRWVPDPATRLFTGTLTRDNFGIHYVRWPYDPAVSVGGGFTSTNPSRYQAELGNAVGWMRAFDPNIFGRYIGGSFTQDGTSSEGTPHPYGRMTGGTWYQGMLKSDGTYDFSKLGVVLDVAQAKGLKTLVTIGAQGAYWDGTNYIEYPLPTGEYASQNWAGYQARIWAFLNAMFDYAGNRIGAIEMANEPGKLVRLNTVVGAGHTEQLTVMCRLAKLAINARGLSTLVLSPPFQGGETGEITSFCTASASGISVNGNDGTGTTGKDWIDVGAHHNYGNFSDRAAGGSTTAMDAAGVNDPVADTAYPNNTTFTDMLAKARAVRAAFNVGGFRGPIWNTEFNVTGSVSNGAWYPRKMTQSGQARIFQQALVASFAGGYDKCFIYALDHPTLGTYDDVGTPPAGEPADWYFKAPDNTARGAAALAQAIAAMTGGELVLGTTGASANPFLTVSAAQLKVSSSSSGGVFA